VKLQCDLCREIVVADFAVDGGAIQVHCPACQKTFEVKATRGDAGAITPTPGPPPAAVEKAARPPGPMVCPKCGDAQPEAAACRTCGLLAAKMSDFARTAAPVPPELEAAWSRAQEAWRDPASHDTVHVVATATSGFAWAAQRYRDRLRADPTDTIAAEQLARLARSAELTLFATATKKPDKQQKPFKGSLVVLAILAVLVVIGVGYAIFAGGLREDPGGPPAAAPAKVKPPKAAGSRP
jgi:hypothetical protein